MFPPNYKLQKINSVYIDIYSCTDLKQFTDLLVTNVLQAFPPKSSMAKSMLDFPKSVRPVISHDALSGLPQVSVDFNSYHEYEQSLSQLFRRIDESQKPVVVMIDEFQQIASFPEQNVEALLRSIVQGLNQCYFICSGSHKHMLTDMFGARDRPFYMSTQLLHQGPIQAPLYAAFINNNFTKAERCITSEAMDEILQFSRRHTYYTQALCNRLFATKNASIDLSFVRQEAY